jgi:hypothetical protein
MARTYTAFLDPGRDFVRVKDGFSWPALLFGVLWASSKKLWGVLFAMWLVECALYALGASAQAQRSPALALLQLALVVAFALVRGFFGNAWRRASLRRRGYRVVTDKRAPGR